MRCRSTININLCFFASVIHVAVRICFLINNMVQSRTRNRPLWKPTCASLTSTGAESPLFKVGPLHCNSWLNIHLYRSISAWSDLVLFAFRINIVCCVGLTLSLKMEVVPGWHAFCWQRLNLQSPLMWIHCGRSSGSSYKPGANFINKFMTCFCLKNIVQSSYVKNRISSNYWTLRTSYFLLYI